MTEVAEDQFSTSEHLLSSQFHRFLCFLPYFLASSLLALALPLAQPSFAADDHVAQDARNQDAQTKAAQTPTMDALHLTSSSFEADAALPAKYTCDGTNVSPALAWNDPPAATKAFALIVDDPDAPGKTFVHWVIYDIPGTARMLPEGVPNGAKLDDGSQQGKNDHGKTGYSGPCPPKGVVHHYFFKLYALDAKTNLKPQATKPELVQAMKGHILAEADLIGRFEH
jgi:Raf kinase inhibitor-like YbhB/YbcL family protein